MNSRVEICGFSTETLPKLSHKQATELLMRYKSGDPLAKDEFIIANLRLVLSVIKRFASCKENIDDIFQVGCVGLLKAARGFDTKHQVRFSTYAVPMIMGEIKRYLRDNTAVRISRSIRDTAYKALSAKELLEKQLGREVSNAEIATQIETPYEDVVFALDAICDPVSLYEPIYNQSGDVILLMDQIGDKKCSDTTWTQNACLCECINHLCEKEQNILKLRYFQGKTQMEVSNEVGISQAQVSRLEKTALKKIKEALS
ncbi:MAG: SigB/SigF/SigG family RNA polymerase sigma factor [Bacillota bacterium]